MEWPVEAIVTAIIAALSGAAVVVRYVFKIERSFSDQRVINEKHIAAFNLLLEKLRGHEALDETVERRVTDLERQVAFGGGAR